MKLKARHLIAKTDITDTPFVSYMADTSANGIEDGEKVIDTNTLSELVYDATAGVLVPTVSKSPFTYIDHTNSPYTPLASDAIIYAGAAGGAITVALPAAAGCKGWKITVKKIDASANAVTIDADSSETIDGATTKVLHTQNDIITIFCNGSYWFIVDQKIASAYGNMYAYQIAHTVTVSAADTWYEVDGDLTGGEEHLVTFGSSHEMVVTRAGKYLVNWSMSMTDGSNNEIMGTIMVNGTAQTKAAGHTHIPSANKFMAVAGSTILDLAASDAISLAVLNEDAASDITVEHATCSITEILV